jgi:hypothetical protein
VSRSAALFAVATFLLIQVMVRPAARSSRLSNAPIVTTLLFFVAFAGLSIWFNRYMTERKHRAEPSPTIDLTKGESPADSAERAEQAEEDDAETVLGSSARMDIRP